VEFAALASTKADMVRARSKRSGESLVSEARFDVTADEEVREVVGLNPRPCIRVGSTLSHKSDPGGEIPPRRDAKDLVPRLWTEPIKSPYPSPVKF